MYPTSLVFDVFNFNMNTRLTSTQTFNSQVSSMSMFSAQVVEKGTNHSQKEELRREMTDEMVQGFRDR